LEAKIPRIVEGEAGGAAGVVPQVIVPDNAIADPSKDSAAAAGVAAFLPAPWTTAIATP
jgi:hypothetical protein